MLTLEDAIDLAVRAHKGQKDLSGSAYILHPLTVMSRMNTDTERIVAVLHDVTEDSEYTIDDIIDISVTEEMTQALILLDKNNHRGENGEFYDSHYEKMITKIKNSPIARKVKIADLEHNMDIRRIIGRRELTDKDKARLGRYLKAWSFLKGE